MKPVRTARSDMAAVSSGADIALEIVTPQHPPVLLAITAEAGVGEDAPDVLDRLEQLRSG